MPVARFQLPDGRVARFEVPEGTTPEQAQTMMEAHFAAQPASAPAPQPRGTVPAEAKREEPGVFESIGAGLGAGFGRGVLGIESLVGKGLEAVGLENIGRVLREDVQKGRERLKREIEPYKEASPYITGGAEFVGETVAPIGVITKTGQAIRAAGAVAPSIARVATPLGTAIETGGFRTGLAPGVANRLLQLTGGAAAAGGTEAMLSGEVSPETATAAGLGAAVPIVLPVLGQLGLKGISKATDYFTGMTPTLRAKQIMEKAAGPELESIKKALAAAPESETAGQAAAYVKQPTFQALQELAERKDVSGELFKKTKAQEIGRKKQLAEVSPVLSEAEEAREAFVKPIYEMAFEADKQRLARREAERLARIEEVKNSGLFPYSPAYKKKMAEASKIELPSQIKALKGNPIIEDAAKEASILAKSEGRDLGDPMASLRGLHYMKIAIDNQFSNRAAATSLQKYSERALASTKEKLLNAIEGTDKTPGISKVYGLARKQYGELSKPVNQALILDELQKVLRSPGGVGEKEAAFLNILGAGENALIKRAGGQPRFGGLREVLTPEQMKAFEDVAAQLQANRLAAEQASAGREGLAKILQQETGGLRLPSLFGNRYTAATNTILDQLAGKVNEKTMNALIRGMESGKSANELLSAVPASERNKILLELKKAAQQRPVGYSVGIGQLQAQGTQ